jgi:hypothetical protein
MSLMEIHEKLAGRYDLPVFICMQVRLIAACGQQDALLTADRGIGLA